MTPRDDLCRRRRLARHRGRDRRPAAWAPSPRPPRPASRARSARSRGSSRSTTGACSPPRPTRSARSSCSGAAPDRLRWCGADLAAHCLNDVLTTGAEPLFFLDYVAANAIDVEQVAELVEGAADVCRAAGCAILGGETAELPGIYREGELDFCGTAVGVVDRDRLVDGSRIEAGDVVLGFPSAGIHANGFSLVRRIVGEEPFDADLLLPPTRLYLDDVRALRARADVRGSRPRDRRRHRRQPRARPAGRSRCVVDPDAWERPEVFGWLAEQGVAEDELRRVFNIGIGYCAIVPAADAPAGDLVIGEIVEGGSVTWA